MSDKLDNTAFLTGDTGGFLENLYRDYLNDPESVGADWQAFFDELGEERGTSITIFLKEDELEFLEPERLKHIVTTYSDHIAIPILLDGESEKINAAAALWTQRRSEISEEQYKEFYHHVGHSYDKPWMTIHARAEGKIEYSLLLFIPSTRPFDLFEPERKHRVKLYVRRVFITDDYEGLIPPYLRFLRGIIDSEDLPLNVSRELLQSSPIIKHIKGAVVRRIIGELKKKADKEPTEFAEFWKNFGPVIKEGIYEDVDNRKDLLKIAQFHSTKSGDEFCSLKDYSSRMQEGQESIYYITGESLEALRRSPQLEGFVARGIEVLLLTDAVDGFWVPAVSQYEETPFKSVTHGIAELDDLAIQKDQTEESEEQPSDSQIATLIALLKQTLGEAIKDVRISDRLQSSAVCLVADDSDLDLHLAKMLKQQGQISELSPRVLEINPRHHMIKALAYRATETGAADALKDAAHLLLDQARISEGESIPDAIAFSNRLAEAITRSIRSEMSNP